MRKDHPRVVSLVPSWTETLYQFGFDAEVVGVTRYCVHPKELVAHAKKVGGTKDPDIPLIASLHPDLVIANHEENRKEDVAALRAAGLDVWVSDVRNVSDSLRDIRELGRLTNKDDAADALVERIRAAMDDVRQAERVKVFVPIWRNPWMTLTKDTYAHDVLSLCGAENVFGGAEGRYPERTPEQAREAGAVAALLPTEPYPFHEKPQAAAECEAAGLRVGIVDGEALTWYGAREAEGLRVVRAAVDQICTKQ